MLDIKLLRTNPELVKENIKKKFQDQKLVLVDEVATLTSLIKFSHDYFPPYFLGSASEIFCG